MRTRQRFILTLGSYITGFVAICSVTTADDVVAKVKEAWQRRATAIQRVRYHMSGTAMYMPGSLTPPGHHEIPEDDPAPLGYPEVESSFPIRLDWTLDLSENRLRRETHEKIFNNPAKQFRPLVQIQVFNGRESKSWYPRSENTSGIHAPHPEEADVWIRPTNDTLGYANVNDTPVFFAHGLFDLKPGSLRSADVGSLSHLSVVGEVQTADGTQSVVSKRTAQDSGDGSAAEKEERYWVDLNKAGAITRWELLVSSLVYARINIRWKQHGPHWLPERWECESFSEALAGTTKLRSSCRMTVDRVEVDPPLVQDEFEIPLKRGMIVQHQVDNSRFRVAADGKTLEPWDDDPPPVPRSWWGGFSALAIGGLAIGCVAVCVAIGWWRNGRQ